MEKKPLISIIVPIYNSEKFIERCIISLISQTYNKIEIILINDGSKDLTASICKKYMRKYAKKIVYIERENKGRSYSRNEGIKLAKGKYILFVDSDDYLKLDACQKLSEMIRQNNFDIIVFNYLEISEQNINERKIKNKNTLLHYNNYVTYCWNKIFKKEHILENKISFPEDINNSEDFYFSFLALAFTKNVGYLNEELYNYVQHGENSIFNIKNRYDTLKMFEKLYKVLKNEKISTKVINLFFINFKYYGVKCFFLFLTNQKKISKNEFRDNIKKYRENLLKLEFITLKLKIYIFFYSMISNFLRKLRLYNLVFKINEILKIIKNYI